MINYNYAYYLNFSFYFNFFYFIIDFLIPFDFFINIFIMSIWNILYLFDSYELIQNNQYFESIIFIENINYLLFCIFYDFIDHCTDKFTIMYYVYFIIMIIINMIIINWLFKLIFFYFNFIIF